MGEMILNPTKPIPSEIFRYFDESKWADRLVAGYVWITTLENCRRAEREGQKDQREAMHTRHADALVGDGTDIEFATQAEEVGFIIGPRSRDIIIRDATREDVIPDAYVICATEHPTPGGIPGIGKHGVRIRDPRRFVAEVTTVFSQEAALRSVQMDRVTYDSRDTEVGQPVPGPLGFVKPKDKYAAQHEIRILWLAEPAMFPLEGRELSVPSVIPLCERLP